MSFLEFCKETLDLLENCGSAEFAPLYVKRRNEAFQMFHNGLICSTSHGINYFNNVVNFIENPDGYKETVSGKSEYEENFRNVLRNNQ